MLTPNTAIADVTRIRFNNFLFIHAPIRLNYNVIYSPVAHGLALQNEEIAKIAKKYGVSIPQLCIRYDWQLGMIVIPKTANPDHQKENMAIDFVISDEDMETLKNMEKIESYGEFGVFAIYGAKLKA